METLFDSGFIDYVISLVYLIIVLDELFVSESSVSQLHFYHPYIALNLVKLLKRIHMVSLITVLNGNVEQLYIFVI